MEVGEYVRTKQGIIDRIYEYKEDTKLYICEKELLIDTENVLGVHIQDITKHSKNPKDLIEPGDFVNGKCCIDIEEYIRDNGTTNINFICLGGSVLAEDIKSIEYEV